jgi:hypothetical protein
VAEARIAAVEELFVALEAVMHSYRSLSEDERDERMSNEAVVITGEIAGLCLVAAAAIVGYGLWIIIS